MESSEILAATTAIFPRMSADVTKAEGPQVISVTKSAEDEEEREEEEEEEGADRTGRRFDDNVLAGGGGEGRPCSFHTVTGWL